jgi:hypothetical protein
LRIARRLDAGDAEHMPRRVKGDVLALSVDQLGEPCGGSQLARRDGFPCLAGKEHLYMILFQGSADVTRLETDALGSVFLGSTLAVRIRSITALMPLPMRGGFAGRVSGSTVRAFATAVDLDMR